ncbi:MAG: topoisomerase C-terminal repeat-containing protein, partial [Alphaproteobacteria bacterium]
QYLNDGERKLYDLIWRRTIAAEMAEAQIDQVAVDLHGAMPGLRLRATGSTIAFDGFLKVYREDKDDAPTSGAESTDDERRLPPMSEGEATKRQGVDANQHFTQPPPRYGEASLVKKLEELGIGRPSTYASTLQVLQDREYVVLDKRRFTPSDKGRLVTTFLISFFTRYVEYDFTARMEEKLDEISDGQINWKKVLREFWDPFSAVAEGTQELRTRAVIDSLDEELGPHFFPDREDGTDPRLCQACSAGRLGLRLGRHGPFIGCSGYPECRFTRRLSISGDDEDGADVAAGPKVLGTDPESGLEVTLRKGPYGLYVQLGEPEGKKRPKRSSLPKGMPAAEITLETALGLLSLPRDIAPHPEDGVMIQAGIGRFGPYVKHDRVYVSLEADDEVLTIGINRAVDLIASKANKRGGAKPLREMGEHPGDKKPITLHEGRYGPYAKHGRVNATIPKDKDPATLTLEEAIALVDARAAKGKSPRKATKAKTKKTAKPKAKTTKSKASAKPKASVKTKTKAKAKPKATAETTTTETTTG